MIDRASTRGSERHRSRLPLGSVSRYDLVLLVIPVAFVLALLAVVLFSITPRTSLTVASVVGGVAVVDSLFVNPPQTGSGRE